MAKPLLAQPIFWPFYGLLPIIFGSLLLAGSADKFSTCADSDYCGFGQALFADFLIAVGIIYAIILGLMVAIRYRKRIVWVNWLGLWAVMIILGAVILLLAWHHYQVIPRGLQ